MNKQVERFVNRVSSAKLMMWLLVIYIVWLGAATFIESLYDSELAKLLCYNNWLFFGLQFLLIVNFVAMAIRMHLCRQRKWGVLILHYGFIVVLLGAMTTFVFGSEGLVHVREGETSNVMINTQGEEIGRLPFGITLNDFVLERYSGSGSPSSFESMLTIDGQNYRAYMNNVVYVGQWRIYQSSYDQDLGGSILTVNRDMMGTVITYIGYLMLLIGMIGSLIHRQSRFRTLFRSLPVLLLLFAIGEVTAQPVDLHSEKMRANDYAFRYAVPDTLAEKFGRLMVQTSQGRIEPVDTYARELLRKFSRATSYGKLSANRVLLGILSQGQMWARVPMLAVQNDELLKIIGTTDHGMIAFVDILNDRGEYKLDSLVKQTHAKSPAARNKFDKEVLKLDEKVNILNALLNGSYLALFPHAGDPEHHWYSGGDDLSRFGGPDSMFVSQIVPWLTNELQASVVSGDWSKPSKILGMIHVYQDKKSDTTMYSSSRISAELLYNKLELFKWSGFGYMGLGLVMIIMVIVSMVTGRRMSIVLGVLSVTIIGVFLAQMFAMGLRWYISERAPWTNGYESMIYVGWATALTGLLFMRRSKITFALATFFAGVILFVSTLSWMDPQITPLVPVLKSYWLVVHVAVVTASYGFFGIGFLLGFTSLLLTAINYEKLKVQITELRVINELALWIGLCLMTAGTFLGAVWANESWGRYWGWDPKETWALITVVVYAVVLHVRLIPQCKDDYWFSVLSVAALGSVLMTFFGVNYYLTGLHSYGGDSAPPAVSAIWVVYSVVVVVAVIAWLRLCKQKAGR